MGGFGYVNKRMGWWKSTWVGEQGVKMTEQQIWMNMIMNGARVISKEAEKSSPSSAIV